MVGDNDGAGRDTGWGDELSLGDGDGYDDGTGDDGEGQDDESQDDDIRRLLAEVPPHHLP